MDKLARQLKLDAERIDVHISSELEQRIEASLHGVSPQREQRRVAPQRPAWFWVTSSLTGIAATLAVIVLVNSPDTTEVVPPGGLSPVVFTAAVPVIDWKTESAMLTSPLQQELEDLQADIKKAEQMVKRDIGL